MPEPVKKKVVRVASDSTNRSGGSTWKPSPAAKQQATTLRIIAVVLWLLAIAAEAFAIFWVLRQSSVNLTYLIIAIIVIGILAIIGSLLWKRANQADPASRSEPIRFFIQNQLGAILALLAFLPLIILIFLNKNMDGKQKGIAGGIGIVVLVIAALFGVSFNPPSTEQYDAETAAVIQYTGQDLVFWTKEGSVYHLCEAVSALHLEAKDKTIYSGTVGDAHAAGKERLTLQVDQELEQCGFDAIAAPTMTSAP